MQEEKSLHYILGGSLVAIALFVVVALVMINSQAITNTAVSINNAAPTVTSVYLSNGEYVESKYYSTSTMGDINDLAAGTTIARHITGKVADANGNGDIDTVSAVLYRTSVTSACSADNNSCYRVATCTVRNTDGNPLSKDYSCPVSLQYFMDSTATGGRYASDDWSILVTVDDGSTTGTDNTLAGEVNTLLSLNIPDAINYGSLGLGATTTTATNQVMNIVQNGNDEADVEISSGAAMSCTLGNIPVQNQHWALTDVGWTEGDVWTLTTALGGSAADTNLNVAYQDSDSTATNANLFWNIEIPNFGVGGTCTGTTTITAIAH